MHSNIFSYIMARCNWSALCVWFECFSRAVIHIMDLIDWLESPLCTYICTKSITCGMSNDRLILKFYLFIFVCALRVAWLIFVLLLNIALLSGGSDKLLCDMWMAAICLESAQVFTLPYTYIDLSKISYKFMCIVLIAWWQSVIHS